MHIKNAVILSQQLLPSFPMIDSHCETLSGALKDLLEGKQGELTADLQILCVSFQKTLESKQIQGRLLPASKFHAVSIVRKCGVAAHRHRALSEPHLCRKGRRNQLQPLLAQSLRPCPMEMTPTQSILA